MQYHQAFVTHLNSPYRYLQEISPGAVKTNFAKRATGEESARSIEGGFKVITLKIILNVFRCQMGVLQLKKYQGEK